MAADGGSVNERILELITDRSLDLQRFTASQRREASAFLKELEAEIVTQIARIDPMGVDRATYQSKRLEKLLQQVRETIRTAYRARGAELTGELKELAEIEAAFAASSVNSAVGVSLMTDGMTRGQLSALLDGVLVQGAPISEWWERQAGDTLQRFTDQMRLGIAQGETIGQLIRRVRGGTHGGEPVSGIMSTSRHHADALVRSATQAVSQKARQATYEGNADLLKGIIWASTLDLRTTVGCAARDNKLYSVKDHKPLDHDLPWENGPGQRHWGCRSTSAPVTKSWRDIGFDIDDLPASTRASMNGQVPQDTSFEAWLAKKTKAQQNEALGPGRADLWRDGKLTFRDLVDARGRELTLEQLRQRF
ncbi:phage minor head protein [Pseudophaeobacter sp.]|uniref:phage minor head protein n=1 Tax=Pseudophaeobacter sp. TaxID=1971739 RepID=UPI00327E178A